MKLLITGVSHKTAPVEVRERLAFREETLPDALADLKARDGVAEAVILSTCNRVEITVTTDDRVDPQSIVDSFLADQKPVDPADLDAASLPARRPRRHPPSLPRRLQPRFHGGGRAADSRTAESRLRRGQRLRHHLRLARRADDPLLQRGQARALGNRHRPDGRLGQLRRGRTGAQDLRHPEQPHHHDRGRGQDVANWPPATCAARARRTSSSPTGRTNAPSKWRSCSRARRWNTPASSACCPRSIS